ncbi:MAG: endonuclease III [Firmicutes bacterium]|nr:endonuclease III [Bacillota bacterium]
MKKTKEIIEILVKMFPEAKCELNFSSPFELLVATILSAQCTDIRVNKVTNELFKKHNTPLDFANLEYNELEKLIHSCGFYRNKAKSIIDSSRAILERHNGEVPNDMEKLTALSGVGRKTANVVLSNAFNAQTIAVDTHVFRTSRRLGLSNGKTPHAVEKDLMNVFEFSEYSITHHLLIFLGRYICKSRSPECHKCDLKELCDYYRDEISQN